MRARVIMSDGIRMGSDSQIHSGSGDNVGRDKYVVYISPNMDVGRLREILETNGEKIKDLFQKIEEKNTALEIAIDDKTLAIEAKNKINGLAKFYEEFIKAHEGKLLALDIFFKENDYMDKIESAAYHLKMYIFSKENRETAELDPAIFDELIQEHNKAMMDIEDKDVMTLLLFYLYRFCYIGKKNGI